MSATDSAATGFELSVGQADRRRTRWSPAALHGEQDEPRKKRTLWWTPAWISLAAGLFLSLVGVAAISTTRPEHGQRQAAFLVIGLASAATVALPHYRWIRRALVPLLILTTALLVFVLLPFVPESIVRPRNGARAWIALGPVDFQPSELAKTVYILSLAAWLSVTQIHRTLRGFAAVVGITLVPIGLILLEPDLGSALLFLPTMAAMLIAAGAKKRHVIGGVVLAMIMVPIAYGFLLKPYQRARIDAILAQVAGDTRFEKREGFQGWRAMRLVGSGGAFGVGEEHARALVTFNGLPEEHNDMIFAVVCCRWGVAGGLAVWTAYAFFAIGGILTALIHRDAFARLSAIGIVAITFTQMTINTGMTIGLLPITGITLPFVSYGGSSLVASWINLGLLVNIGLRRAKLGERSYLDELE
ncbi:MAG: FtsW/RodA/SpoVE family cell cycle protein [Phycisphaerales bacterium]